MGGWSMSSDVLADMLLWKKNLWYSVFSLFSEQSQQYLSKLRPTSFLFCGVYSLNPETWNGVFHWQVAMLS